jgi:transposase
VARYRQPVRAVIESMNGARFVHDTLEELGWEVLVADAQKVKGLAPLACKTDRIDARVLAVLSQRDLVPAIWLPDPTIRRVPTVRSARAWHGMRCSAQREVSPRRRLERLIARHARHRFCATAPTGPRRGPWNPSDA